MESFYPPDSNLSTGYSNPGFEQLGPGLYGNPMGTILPLYPLGVLLAAKVRIVGIMYIILHYKLPMEFL